MRPFIMASTMQIRVAVKLPSLVQNRWTADAVGSSYQSRCTTVADCSCTGSRSINAGDSSHSLCTLMYQVDGETKGRFDRAFALRSSSVLASGAMILLRLSTMLLRLQEDTPCWSLLIL